MQIITVANQKGGVGKSTTTLALGYGLARLGRKVLIMDLDSQGNTTYSSGLNGEITSMDVLTRSRSLREAIVHGKSIDLVPSDPNLAMSEKVLDETGKEYILKEAIEELGSDEYDYVVLDTPPALGTVTVNALTAADSVIIPSQPDIYSIQGISQLNETISAVRKYCNPNLKIDGILATRYNTRSIINRDMVDSLGDMASVLKTKVYETKIRENVAVKEAAATQTDIYSYAPKSNGAQDYMNFVKEVLEEEKEV